MGSAVASSGSILEPAGTGSIGLIIKKPKIYYISKWSCSIISAFLFSANSMKSNAFLQEIDNKQQ